MSVLNTDLKSDHMAQNSTIQNSGHMTTLLDTHAPTGRGPDSDGTGEMIQTMHDIHSWAMSEIVEQDRIRRAQYEEWRKREQCRIWLEHIGSPLAPYTQVMQDEAARVGSTIYMCPAVAMAESSGGLVNMAPHNAWGLMERKGGFGSWEEGIAFFYGFLYRYNISRGYAAVNGSTTPNYCQPPHPWMENVDQCIRDIQAIEVAPYESGP